MAMQQLKTLMHGMVNLKASIVECNVRVIYKLILITLSAPSPPRSFSLSPVADSPTQLSASWSVPIPRNGIITGYSVYCNTSEDQTYPEQMIGPNVPTIRSVVNETTLATTLTGLNPFTYYSCYVTANTSFGEGGSSNVFTNSTIQSGDCCNVKKELAFFNAIHQIYELFSFLFFSSITTNELFFVTYIWFST